jgi:hypothetical protein
VRPPAGRHALLWVALAASVCATRPVVAWVQEPSWVAVSASGTGMHTDTHALWRVAVTAHGFGGFDSVRLVPVTPGAAVLGGGDVADLRPRGRVTFTVSVPLDVREATFRAVGVRESKESVAVATVRREDGG